MKNNLWLKTGILASIVSICLSMINLIPCIGCLIWPITCTSWFLIPFIAGYLAVLWKNLKRDQFEEGAKQGALAGLTISIIAGSLNACISFISSLIHSSAGTALSFLNNENFLEEYLPTSLERIGATAFGLLIGCLCGFFFNILFATIGGIIKVALSKD